MICYFCGAEIDESYTFCPLCGKKAIKRKLAPFTRADWFLSPAGERDAKNQWMHIKEMDYVSARNYLQERMNSFDVWTIGVEYTITGNLGWGKKKKRFSKAVSISSAKHLLDREKNGEVTDVIFFPNRRPVAKIDLEELYTEGGSSFLSKTECQEIIDTSIYGKKRKEAAE